ncbi:MAG: LUD domain-containing protein, partial [Candidatus Micrarchaeota archaeon]
MGKWDNLAEKETIARTISALKANGINAQVAQSGEEAKKLVLGIIPEGSEVMTMTSTTMDQIGISKTLNEGGKYRPVRAKLMDKAIAASDKKKFGGGPNFATGSVHAVTEDGKLVVVSATGSQLGAYAYGAGKVIWVVSTAKIVKNLDDAMSRIEEYVLPLESERARKAYGA